MTSKKRVKGFYLHTVDEARLDEIHRGLMRNEIEAHNSLIVAAAILALKTMGTRSTEYFVKLVETERAQAAAEQKPVNLNTKEMASRFQARFKEKGMLNMEPTKDKLEAMKNIAKEVLAEMIDEQNEKDA